MIRRISIDVDNAAEKWLRPYKRQDNRKGFLRAILSPFRTLMADYKAWRDTAITRVRVTGETMSLEWYLNLVFDPVNQDIYVESAGPDGVLAGIEGGAEDGFYVTAGLETSEAASYVAAGLEGETSAFGTASFAVFVPTTYTSQATAIAAVVRTYKLAGKSFVINFF